MDLLIVRHAKSMSREKFNGEDDWERPISDEGRHEMEEAAVGLRNLVPDVRSFVSSPLKRAKQTRSIVRDVYSNNHQIKQTEALAPKASGAEFQDWLRSNADEEPIAIFGHNPSLPRIVSYLLSGQEGDSFVDLKKGSTTLMKLTDLSKSSSGTLKWMINPKQLIKLT